MSQWSKWELIHSAIVRQSFDSVSPHEWHDMLKETLTASTSECQSIPSVCCHCHQLVALSSVTLVLLQMQSDDSHKITEAYIKPLLAKDILLTILRLMKHPCYFMQYHARRTLVTLLQNSGTKEAVGCVVETCLHDVQQAVQSSLPCLESLQLLCGLVSSKASCTSKVQSFAVLQKTLPTLISKFGSVDNITTKPGEECISVASVQNLTDAADKECCIKMRSEASGCRVSVLEASFYLCLCLLQKILKYASSLNVPERVEALKNIFGTTLEVTLNYLLKDLCGNVRERELLVVRKCLEVLDTALHFSGLEKSDSLDNIFAKVSTEFLKRLKAVDCSWSFSCERIFVGGVSQPQQMLGSRGIACRSLDSPLSCNVLLGLLVRVTLKASAICIRVAAHGGRFSSADSVCLCTSVLLSMHSALKKQMQLGSERELFTTRDRIGWLPLLYGEQDDHWLEALLSLLNIYVCVEKLTRDADKCTEETHELLSLADPHTQFLQLLHFISFDDSLVIDWLTAPETCFLQYFTHYLRVLVTDFKALVCSATDFSSRTIYVSMPEDQAELFHTVPCKNPDQLADSHHLAGTKAYIASFPCENWTKITPVLSADKQGSQEQQEQIVDSVMQDQSKPTALFRSINDHVQCERQQEKIRRKDGSSDCVKDVMLHSSGLSLLACYADEDESQEEDVDVDICGGEEASSGSVHTTGSSSVQNSDSGTHETYASNFSGKFCFQPEPVPFGHQSCIGENTCHLKGRELRLTLCSQTPEMTYSNCEPVLSAGPALGDSVESQSEECFYVGKVISLLQKLELKLRRLYEKGLLAYNPRPLLVLLDRCDRLYAEYLMAYQLPD